MIKIIYVALRIGKTELISLNGNTEQNCEISSSSKHNNVSRPLCLIDKSCEGHHASSSSSTLSHLKNSSALVASLQQRDKKYSLVLLDGDLLPCVCVCVQLLRFFQRSWCFEWLLQG